MIKINKILVLAFIGVMLASSSLPAFGQSSPMAAKLGTDFSNDFGLVVDFNADGNPDEGGLSTNVQVLADLGNSSNPLVNPVDTNPTSDQQFFFAHFNVSGVHNIYLAQNKMEYDLKILGQKFAHINGSAPFQTLLQYFQNDGKDILVANTFRGLVAYETTTDNETLDSTDKSYFGYSFVEQHLIDVLNTALTGHSFDAIPQYGFEQIYDPSTHTFGMTYRNYFVVWQNTKPSAPSALSTLAGKAFDNVITGQDMVAASLFDYLTFTYHVEEVSSNDTTTVVRVVTNYDIGPMKWLITKDDTSMYNTITGVIPTINSSNSFQLVDPKVVINTGGSIPNVQINLPTLSFYTDNAVSERIDPQVLHDTDAKGLGIAVASSTNAIVLGSEFNAPQESTNSQDINIPLTSGSSTFFETDFSGKSTYTREFNNGSTQTDLPIYVSTRSMDNLDELLDVHTLASGYFKLQTLQTIGVAIFSAMQLSSGFTSANTNGLSVDETSYVTFVEMPKWSGLKVTQDPSFSAVAAVASGNDSSSSSNGAGNISGAPGFEAIALIFSGTSFYLLKKKQKKN
jgi:hypothetical protein